VKSVLDINKVLYMFLYFQIMLDRKQMKHYYKKINVYGFK